MATWVVPGDYAAVRAALDVSLTTEVLPDDVIGLDLYVGAAERDVRYADPLADTYVGENAERIKAAAILLTAAYLAPAIPRLSSERLADYQYSQQAVDWNALAAHLRARARQELAAISSTDVAASVALRHPAFARASGTRGTW